MQHKHVQLSVLLLLGVSLIALHAQDAIPATGGNVSGVGGSVSYSIGQVASAICTGTNGSLAQGVQQPFEISVVTGLEEAKGITLQCSVYPNPASNYLTLKVDASNSLSIPSITYQLFDLNGQLLECKKMDSNETTIVMGHLVPATYFLKVTDNNKEFKTFKIIKN
jgi:hypothetical protein